MGLLGIIITVAVMVFGAGYLLSGSSESSLSVENPVVSQQSTVNSQQEEAETRLSAGMAAIESAKQVSQQVTENSQQTADNVQQRTDNSQQPTDSGEGAMKSQDPQSAIKNLQSEISIKNRLVSFGFAKHSDRSIDTIVLHSSYNSMGGDEYSVDKVIGIWKSYGVAPHYMIDRKGAIYRLVEDTNIAYHAGVSEMPDGRENVNDFSIGIEILNTLDDNYTDAQYAAVKRLVASLKEQYKIKYVLGHDDIAPGRKTDPWNFDWKKLK